MRGRLALAVGSLALLILAASVALAAPPVGNVLPASEYTTEKGRMLGSTYASALQELNAGIYHCWPWVDVRKGWIGFYRPKGVQGDDRYLSVHVYIEQDSSAAFERLPFEERSASMFSRYVGPLLRRMTKDRKMAADPSLDGFTAILEWKKPVAPIKGRPVHETIAVFIDKATALEYLGGRADIQALTARARILGFDGETALGSVTLAPTWDDTFVSTYKVQNYQLEAGVTC